MLSLLSLVTALPWRWLAAITCASILFSAGVRLGEQRITTQWEEAKIMAAQAVAIQTNQVAQITAKQTTINQEISNEFKAAKAQLAADRQHLLARVPGRVRNKPAGGDGTVPGVPVSSNGVAAASTDAVSAGQPLAIGEACQRLAEDAAQTTLMLVGFQRWYVAQTKNGQNKNGP
jgi:hypothetical protein